MKKLSILFVFIMICLLAACNSVPEHPTEEYTLTSGITLTAEECLTEQPLIHHDISLQNENIVVVFDAEPKEYHPDFTDLEFYAAAIKEANSFENDLSLDSFDNLSYAYEGVEFDDDVFCYLIVEETETCYWLIQMWCPVELRSVYEPLFPQWLDSIELPETVVAPIFHTKEYNLDCGFSLIMPDDMTATEVYGFDAYYLNNELHISLQLMDKPAGWTLDDFTKWFANKMNVNEIGVNPSGHPYVVYKAELIFLNYYYITIHETADSFVILWQNCDDMYKDSYMEFMLECADSLRET